ncbi:XrtA system polysaccharide chain length determinant [Lichenicola sp.]|uniref:XrtA system polysaccharide chain length determinant n=1 Tax=Lichenicola sp. TaxID=2804529 RepID=UPI003AFF7693
MGELRDQLRRYAIGMLQRRWMALAVAWLICAIGWAVVAMIPNRYQASARVYVDADAVLTPLLRGIALDDPLAAQIEELQRTLLSRPNLEKLVSETDLSLFVVRPDDLERMVAALGTQIEVVPQTRNLFTITYRNSNPRLAYDVVRTVLGIFVEDKAGASRTDMANAKTFLGEQIASYEAQLREAEAKRAAFRATYMDLLPAEGSGSTKLDAARDSVRQLEGELSDAEGRRDRLTRAIAVTPTSLVTETDAGTGPAGSGSLAEAQATLREMLTTLTDRSPDVIRQRALIAALKSGGGGTTPARGGRSRSEPNMIHQQLEVMLVQAESDVASLTRRVQDAHRERDRLEQIAHDMPSVQAQYVNLNRDYDVLRKNYEELLNRREAMRLDSAADTRADKIKLEVVDPPQVPRIPVFPDRRVLLSLVLLAGLAGGGASAFLLSQLDRSFHTTLELRSLGLPVAGSLSLLPGPDVRRPRQLGLAVAAPGLCLLLLGAAYCALMLHAFAGFALA